MSNHITTKRVSATLVLGPYTMASLHFRSWLMACSALPIAATFAFTPALAQVAVGPLGGSIAATPAPTGAMDDAFQIRFRADTLVLQPVLGVKLKDATRTAVAGADLHFQTYNNYPLFIQNGEIRVFKAGQSPDAQPLAKIIVDDDGEGIWRVPNDGPEALYFVFRVTGKEGKFDETSPQELTIVAQKLADDLDSNTKPSAAAFGGIDQAVRRTIEISGLMASVSGRADPILETVRVSGQIVPIDRDGKFVAQQIVPRVAGAMNVVISREGQVVKSANQNFSPARDDWFIVGQGDLTLGRSSAQGPARVVSGDTLAQGNYAIGRAAFYAKGVTPNDVRITASVDTSETTLEDLFSNLDRKDPRHLLRRLNSEQYYPTYGDDSTLVEDAPTQGRFYVRAAKGPSQFVVGNFVTEVAGGELLQLDRGLFGALVDINSNNITSFGERKARVTAFASDSGTEPAREEFRGTGGSLYFLKRQDISIGSERLRIEIRDRETGLVLESRQLHPQQDYDFDPFQGRLLLLSPLASTAATDSVVRDGSSSGNVPVLVVRYEYTPPIGSLSGTTLGGRGSVWLGDTVRLGLTAQREKVEEVAQNLVSIDVLHRIAAGTYAKAEVAQSKGPGFDQSNSIDGGLSFTDIANPGTLAIARAWRTELAIDVAELTKRSGNLGNASAYFEHYDKGFSSAGRLSPAQAQRWGLAASAPFATSGLISVKYDELMSDNTGSSRTGVLDISNRFTVANGAIIAKAGLRFEDRVRGLLYNSAQNGKRTDVAVELGYAPRGANWEIHAFGQGTLNRDASRTRNNRLGIGAKRQITERLSLESEISGGDGGQGADVQLNYRRGNGSESYVGYALFADRTDTGLDPQNIFTRSNRGTLTLGTRHRFSDAFSITGENRIGIGGTAPSLTRSFGLKFDPTAKLSIGGAFETGKIDDATTGLFRRTAASLSLGYTLENMRIGSAVEFRDEKGSGRDQRVWLLRNNLSYGLNPDWRFVGQVNVARADNSTLSVAAAEFTDAMAGFAYRPVEHERFNALFRFQYFDDLGPVGQITGSGQIQSPKQTSTIFSGDFNYDVTQHLTIGAKYGYREGKASLTRNSEDFFSSNAHLAIVRMDYNLNAKWDVLAEGRALWVTQARDQKLGALAAVYRHLGNNVKLGVGYSWSEFSDDLTDQSYSSRGPFLNLISKF
jgi:hypothetical protein